MKSMFFAIVLILSMNSYAQVEKTEFDNLFVRVYDLQGKKITKGKVLAVTDQTFQIKGNKGSTDLNVSNIGLFKTKRSAGNNILIGSVIGATLMAIVGATSADPDTSFFSYTAEEGAGAGIIIGLPLGAAAGGLTTLFKNSKSYSIDGDLLKWKVFQEMINGRNY